MTTAGKTKEFVYSSKNLSGNAAKSQRFFEILPGLISWSLLISMVVLSVVFPLAAVIGIIVFDVFWICFMLHSLLVVVASRFRLRIDRDIDWMKRLEALGNPDTLKDLAISDSDRFFEKVSKRIYRHKLGRLDLENEPVPDWELIHHVIILSITDEDRKTITAVVQRIIEQDFPLKRVIVIIAAHENATRSVKETAWKLHREHYDKFAGFYVAPHPADNPEEEPVKGAAVNFGARMAVSALEQKGVEPGHVVVSCLEAKTLLTPKYIACLTWHYLYHPERESICFQPVSTWHPNVWNTPGYGSVLHVGSSFFLQVEATSPDGLVTFSSFSASLKLLTEIGYWPEEKHLADDSAFFWKAYLKKDGHIWVVPIYITITFDDIKADTFVNTIKTIYRKKLLEAASLRNLPVIFRGFLENREISFFQKLKHVIKILQAHVGMATWIFLLLIIGWLPGMISGPSVDTSLGYISSRIHIVIFSFTLAGLVIATILCVFQLPRRKPEFPPKNWFQHLFAWIFLPLVALVLNACPYLVTQTKMMLGRK